MCKHQARKNSRYFQQEVFQGFKFNPANGESRRYNKKNFQSFAGSQILLAYLRFLTMLLILFSPGICLAYSDRDLTGASFPFNQIKKQPPGKEVVG